jgi:uncharacterized phage protein (TIGR01671 family)
MFPTLPMEMRNTNGIDGIEVDYNTLGQFTGLTDKNGKKIFEGDIVKLFFYDKEQDINYELIGQVESVLLCGFITIYEEKVNALQLFNKTISNKIEIIGNQWDNPELLEKDKCK